jgi:hypothetical protein
MQFTPLEMRLIERLRKQERQWRWMRWVFLGLSLFITACYGYLGISVYHHIHWGALTTEDAALIAVYWPKILLAMCLAAWFIVWPLTSWRGNATRLLLLKLLDAQSQKTG